MFLLIDNYDSFTFNLVQAFQIIGLEPKVVRNDSPELVALARAPELSGVCISPGPGRPDAAGFCLDFLKELRPEVPVLGVCLGHQILGRFAGARVEVGPHIVHGKASDIKHDGKGIFQGLPQPMRVGRYHSLLVNPEGMDHVFEVTARTKEGEVMGLSYKDRPWFGVQFHPESILTPDGMLLLSNFASMLSETRRQNENAQAHSARGAHPNDEAGTPLRLSEVMEELALGNNLSPARAHAVFSRLMDGELSPAQAGAFLLGLRAKGETPEEMVAAVDAILERSIPVGVPEFAPVIDVVGTGGDGKNSFNCSTGTALILASLGHKVLKHGNRSVSSRCGSADVLEGLGISLDGPVEEIPAQLEEDGFAFLFAPRFHPSFRHIMPIRRELGVRTLFNLLGPLVNPAKPGICFFGVPSQAILPLVANTLAKMGGRSGAVIYGAGGYDELTTMGVSQVAYIRGGSVRFDELDPSEYGFSPCEPEELAITGPEQGVAVLRQLLEGKGPQAMKDMLALNVGFGLHLLQPERTLPACMAEGRKAVSDGTASGYLRRLSSSGRNAAAAAQAATAVA